MRAQKPVGSAIRDRAPLSGAHYDWDGYDTNSEELGELLVRSASPWLPKINLYTLVVSTCLHILPYVSCLAYSLYLMHAPSALT